MRLTPRESEMDRQAIGVHHRVYLAGQAAPWTTHILMNVVRDASTVLVHPHDGSIDHWYGGVMTGGQCIHDLVPDASAPPPNEAIVTGGAGIAVLRQVAPWRT